MRLIEWLNGITKLSKATMDEFQNNINLAIGDNMPIGSGFDYYGENVPNENFMWADGSAISRENYSELFNIIGTIYGAGDGSTTFNLPDLRKRYPLAKDDNDTLGTTGGSEELYAQVNPTGGGMNYQNSGQSFTTNYAITGAGGNKSASSQSNSNAGIAVVGITDSTTSREPFLICNYVIKVK